MSSNQRLLHESPSTRVSYFEVGSKAYTRKEVLGKFSGLLCSHEVSVLNRLQGLRGVQQIVERDSSASFISEYIPGQTLLISNSLPKDYFTKLKEILKTIHESGVADPDFAHSVDLLVQRDGSPAVIDLASAVIYDSARPLSFLIKPLFDYVCKLNYAYLVQRKARFQNLEMTPGDWAEYNSLNPIIGAYSSLRRNIRKKKNMGSSSVLICKSN